jgi:galactokinase
MLSLKRLGTRQGATFRDFAAADILESMGNLPEEIRRRCLHIVQEIRRVSDAETALANEDIPALAKIFARSHESLRDLYEVSCPEVDWLVKRAQETEGVAASRMTGKGFGGCTFTFIESEAAEAYKLRLEDYERIFGFHPVAYEMKIGSGARVLAAPHVDFAKALEGRSSRQSRQGVRQGAKAKSLSRE